MFPPVNINHSTRVVNTNHSALFCEYQSFHSPSEHQHSSHQTGDPLPVEELDGWKAGRQTIFENECYHL